MFKLIKNQTKPNKYLQVIYMNLYSKDINQQKIQEILNKKNTEKAIDNRLNDTYHQTDKRVNGALQTTKKVLIIGQRISNVLKAKNKLKAVSQDLVVVSYTICLLCRRQIMRHGQFHI